MCSIWHDGGGSKVAGKGALSGSNPLMLKLARVSAPEIGLAFGECRAPAIRQRRIGVSSPARRVGLRDQADFAHEEVSMSPQTTPAELPFGHLGFGAMRITGQGIWGALSD